MEWYEARFAQGMHAAPPATYDSTGAIWLEARLRGLRESFTLTLYSSVCRSLFERHKGLFSLALAGRVLEAEGLLVHDEWSFLLAGASGVGSRDGGPGGSGGGGGEGGEGGDSKPGTPSKIAPGSPSSPSSPSKSGAGAAAAAPVPRGVGRWAPHIRTMSRLGGAWAASRVVLTPASAIAPAVPAI